MIGAVVEVSARSRCNRERRNRTTIGWGYDSGALVRARIRAISRNATVVYIYKETVHVAVSFNQRERDGVTLNDSYGGIPP
jgi:hypothetical protein